VKALHNEKLNHGPIRLTAMASRSSASTPRKIERWNGQPVKTTIDTVKDVSRFFVCDPKQFLGGRSPGYGVLFISIQ